MTFDFANAFDKAVAQITDRYERQARLVPALLALLPIVVMLLSLYKDRLTALGAIFSALLACGALFLLSDAARQLGKKREKALWRKWGGTPTTQVLRHRDGTFDSVSKSRYHSTLGAALGMPFPTKAEEEANPELADELYSSANNLLRNATRDTKLFSLLFKDNVSYGFRRNGYGLRWLGLSISAVSIVWVLIRHGMNTLLLKVGEAPNPEAIFSGEEGMSLIVAGVMLVVWLTYFTESTVRDAAFSYAQKLIESCETAQIQKIKKKAATI